MPLAQRSAFPTVPGVSAAVAVAIAVGCTFLGYLIDSARGTELTRAFSAFYLLGCVSAAVLVRYRGLFTAVVQPPLILFLAVPLAYYNLKDSGSSLRDIVLNVALPLVDRFPLMATTTIMVLLVGLVRFYLAHQHSHRTSPAPRVRQRTQTARTQPVRATPPPTRRSRHAETEKPEPTPPRKSVIPPVVPPATGRRAQRPNGTSGARSIPPYTIDEYRSAPLPRRSAERRYRSEVPAHPVPQVRYREREEPPYSR